MEGFKNEGAGYAPAELDVMEVVAMMAESMMAEFEDGKVFTGKDYIIIKVREREIKFKQEDFLLEFRNSPLNIHNF